MKEVKSIPINELLFYNGFMNMRNIIFIELFLNTSITKEISSFEEMIEDLCGLGIGHFMIRSIFIVHPLCAKHYSW